MPKYSRNKSDAKEFERMMGKFRWDPVYRWEVFTLRIRERYAKIMYRLDWGKHGKSRNSLRNKETD